MADLQKTVIVPDVSFYQDDNTTTKIIDFAKMKAAGAPGVIIRAGQNAWIDSDFAQNWKAAKAAGLLRGTYWFYDSRHPPLAQAALFAGLMKEDPAEMEMWCDYEEDYKGEYTGWRHFAVFVAEVKRLLPAAKVGIYCGYYYWQDHSPNPLTEPASFTWFAKFPLWLAWYADASIVKIPAPWTRADYWQFTKNGDGLKYGAESLNIDLSYFNGTRAEFEQRYGIAHEPEPKPEPVIKIMSVKKNNALVDGLLTITYAVDGAPHIAVIDQRVPEPPKRVYFRVIDDIELKRDPIRNGDPATRRIWGGKGSVPLSPGWMAFAFEINKPKTGYQFIDKNTLKPFVGWRNRGDINVVEQVAFAGNIVEADIDADGNYEFTHIKYGACVYIKSLSNEAAAPAGVIMPPGPTNLPLIHNFSIQWKDRLDLSTDGRWCRILIIRNPGERLFMEKRFLSKM